jgi:hypothetical protein
MRSTLGTRWRTVSAPLGIATPGRRARAAGRRLVAQGPTRRGRSPFSRRTSRSIWRCRTKRAPANAPVREIRPVAAGRQSDAGGDPSWPAGGPSRQDHVESLIRASAAPRSLIRCSLIAHSRLRRLEKATHAAVFGRMSRTDDRAFSHRRNRASRFRSSSANRPNSVTLVPVLTRRPHQFYATWTGHLVGSGSAISRSPRTGPRMRSPASIGSSRSILGQEELGDVHRPGIAAGLSRSCDIATALCDAAATCEGGH